MEKQFGIKTKNSRWIRRLRLPIGFLLLAVAMMCYLGVGRVGVKTDDPDAVQSEKGAFPSLSLAGSATSLIDGTDWNLRLVNQSNPLPDGFTVETEALPNGLEMDRRAIGALLQMLQDGRAAGLQFVVCSAYRTVSYQKELFEKEVANGMAKGLSRKAAEKAAGQAIARPGESEHNLGLAVDIVAYNYQHLDQKQMETPEQKWLMAHCGEYGFILRYPESKSHITGIQFEPWHYRYVGVAAAQEIMAKGLCLEEYLGQA